MLVTYYVLREVGTEYW